MAVMGDMINCPVCLRSFKPGRPMQYHLRDAHALTGMRAHLISNPRDLQAARTKTGRRTKSGPLRPHIPDDFDVIER